MAFNHLLLTVVAIAVLIRCRSLVPFTFLLLVAEQAGRFAIKLFNPIARTGASTLPVDPNIVIIALLLIGFALSLSVGGQQREAI